MRNIAATLTTFLALALAGLPLQAEDVPTPFGLFAKECVHQHPHGTKLEKVTDGVKATHPDGETTMHPADPKCELKPDINIAHKWFNFVGWYPKKNISAFEGTYTVPDTPTEKGAQTLFYFIGVQDNSSQPRTILQPVLAFQGNGSPGWSLASWNCCPSGQAHHSSTISGIQPGDKIFGKIQKEEDETKYTITSKWKEKSTELTIDTGSEAFNWANVVLEVYRINSCSEFSSDVATFSDLKIVDVEGCRIKPSWTLYPTGGETQCQGQLTVVSKTEITIQQNLDQKEPGACRRSRQRF